MVRSVVKLSLALTVVLSAACGTGSQSATRQAPGAKAVTRGRDKATQTVDLPTSALDSPRFDATTDGVWVYGGLQRQPGKWVANDVATLYGPSGQVKTTVRLPLATGQFLFYASLIARDGLPPVVVGDTCIVPVSENGGCVSSATPVAFQLDADRFTSLPLPDTLTKAIDSTPGSGLLYGVGPVGKDLVVVRSIGEGPVPHLTFEVAAFRYDPDSGVASEMPLPKGVLTPDSVCANGEGVFAVVPALDDAQQLRAADVFHSPGGSGQWSQLGHLDKLKTKVIVGGHVYCSANALVLQADGSPAELIAVEPRTGQQIGESIQVSTPVTAVSRSVANDTLLFTTSHIPTKNYAVSEQVVVATYYSFGNSLTWQTVGEMRLPIGTVPRGLMLDGHAIEASQKAQDPTNQDSFPVIG